MFGGKGKEILPVNAVLASRQPESGQVAFLNPS
jgi:hypothetical protein